MIGFGGKNVVEWGIRVGRETEWIGSKSDARKMAKKVPGAKLVQHTVKAKPVKQFKADLKCKGGSCKRNGTCRKHALKAGRDWTSSHDIDLGVQPIVRPDGKPF